ncbi:hypothetical protein [Moorena sp. SIO3F7]|nr:hypothetical protein [Moorena sp. SIO3F7]
MRECLFPVPYSLLPAPCSLFPIPCSLCYRGFYWIPQRLDFHQLN